MLPTLPLLIVLCFLKILMAMICGIVKAELPAEYNSTTKQLSTVKKNSHFFSDGSNRGQKKCKQAENIVGNFGVETVGCSCTAG